MTSQIRVRIDKALQRPLDVEYLNGLAAKAERELFWERKVKFRDLVKEMVLADIELMSTKKLGEDVAMSLKSSL